jgi:hypothetical protein
VICKSTFWADFQNGSASFKPLLQKQGSLTGMPSSGVHWREWRHPPAIFQADPEERFFED